MPGDFQRRIKHLEDAVGNGDLVMGAVVGQPYAAAQHNRHYYKHPRGGMSNYLEDPFAHQHPEMLHKIARDVVTPDGSQLMNAAREIAEEFDEMVNSYAPVEFTILRNSTSVYVDDNGMRAYDRPQRAARDRSKE
jgi:hypothetical protein